MITDTHTIMNTSQVTRYLLRDLEQAEREELLASKVSAMLAFVDGKGFPRLVPCWFFWDGGAFYVTSYADKFHVRCLQRNPRASIGIEIAHAADGAVANRQVKGVGEVVISEDVEGYWARRIAEKYLGNVGRLDSGTSRVVIRLEPQRITAHGGGLKISSQPPADSR